MKCSARQARPRPQLEVRLFHRSRPASHRPPKRLPKGILLYSTKAFVRQFPLLAFDMTLLLTVVQISY